MPQRQPSRRTRIVTGRSPTRTRNALALITVLTAVTVSLRLAAPSLPEPMLAYGLLHAFTLEASPHLVFVEGFGVITTTGLATLYAYDNDGYLPTLLVAALPSLGLYTVNGPGLAPIWAASYVLPFTLTTGTLGYLTAHALRRHNESKTEHRDTA